MKMQPEMAEFLDVTPNVDIIEAEYLRLLGYPPSHQLDGRPGELAHWAREWFKAHGHPWVYARRVDDIRVHGEKVVLEGMEFSSKRLHDQFKDAEVEGAFVVAVSAGKECEEMARSLWLEEKPDEYFFLEIFGSTVVEHLVTTTGFRFCAWADTRHKAVLPHYSPGYGGWDISEQSKLMDVIRIDRWDVFPANLEVLDTGMLKPKKSLLAVFGITSHTERVARLSNLVPCQNCSLTQCQYRRMPYRQSLPLIESVERTGGLEEEQSPRNMDVSPLVSGGSRYTVSVTALKKWAKERLTLTRLPDGSTEAQFKYEGSTCSNLGRSLEFLYRVRVGPKESGYRIEHAQCSPSPSDDGYKSMCEYIERGDSLIQEIEEEQPLLGKPLEAILTWERASSPSGCYCERMSRQHKWGLVYEVIHYALAHSFHLLVDSPNQRKNQ